MQKQTIDGTLGISGTLTKDPTWRHVTPIWTKKMCKRVRIIREARKITQVEFAKRLKLSQSVVSKVELGQQHSIPVNVAQVAKALRVDPAALFSKSNHFFQG